MPNSNVPLFFHSLPLTVQLGFRQHSVPWLVWSRLLARQSRARLGWHTFSLGEIWVSCQLSLMCKSVMVWTAKKLESRLKRRHVNQVSPWITLPKILFHSNLATLCCLKPSHAAPSIHPSSFSPARRGGESKPRLQTDKQREKEGRKKESCGSCFPPSFSLFSKQHSTKLEDEFFALSLTPNPTQPANVSAVRARTKDVKTCFRQSCRSFGPSSSYLPSFLPSHPVHVCPTQFCPNSVQFLNDGSSKLAHRCNRLVPIVQWVLDIMTTSGHGKKIVIRQ